jgi:hypothetical protein
MACRPQPGSLRWRLTVPRGEVVGVGIAVGVIGGSGGVGASTFAAVLAWAARGTLVDLDPWGGGIDVLLGIEAVPGARWSGVRVGGGRLDPALLSAGLPRWAGVPVLAVDRSPPAGGVGEVLAAVAELGCTVLDLPRAPSPAREAALEECGLVVVLAHAGVRQLSAARAVVSALPDVNVGTVLRRGEVPLGDAVPLVGAALLGVLPRPAGGLPLGRGRPPRSLARVAAGIVDGLGRDGLGRDGLGRDGLGRDGLVGPGAESAARASVGAAGLP